MKSNPISYKDFARTKNELSVEILRDNNTLIKYKIPWNTRVQSSFLSHPEDDTNGINYNTNHDKSSLTSNTQNTNTQNTQQQTGQTGPMGTSKNPLASKFDPWSGFNKSTPDIWKREKLFLCVPGMDIAPSREVGKFYFVFCVIKQSNLY